MALDSYASPNIIPELRQPNAAAGKITLGGLDRMAVTPSVVTNGAIVIHTQRLKSDPGGNLLS